MKTKKLVEYMRSRAKYENVEWQIPDDYMENMFVQKGTRIFFGVVLDDLGNMLRDERQPNFYNNYISNLKG
jgi:hypothetical protein